MLEQLLRARVEFGFARGISSSRVSGARLALVREQHQLGRGELLALARDLRLLAGELVVGAHAVGDLGEVARARGRHDTRLAAWRRAPSTLGSLPGFTFRPCSARRGSMAWYSAVTPSSLKREAMVPNTGMVSGGT